MKYKKKYNKNRYESAERDRKNVTAGKRNAAEHNGQEAEYNGHAAAAGAGTDNQVGQDVVLGSDSKTDALQAAVYYEGMRVLNVLSEGKSEDQERTAACENAGRVLDELGHFYYNIGFAGEQSCGKSTVVNSLIQYPLMPTCNLTTTCTVVRLVYGSKIRVIATDDDTGKRVFDMDCSDISESKFNRLKEYTCLAMPILVIDNINYFTDKDIYNENTRLTPDDIDMHYTNPREVALLLLVLLSVYIGQNDPEMTDDKKRVIAKRNEIMRYFGIPDETVNYSVLVQWDCDLLKSGIMITDLPGLGASAKAKKIHGRILKSHDDITKEAIQESDAMVFLEEYTVKDVGTAALREMLSSARLKEVVNKGERIIPVLNMADRLKGAQRGTNQQKFADLLLGANVKKQASDIILYSAIFGEYAYNDIMTSRFLYFKSESAEEKRDDGMSEEEIIETMLPKLRSKYETSGIEELKDFFRTTYIERGKYNKAVAAVCAVRNLAIQAVAPLESRAKSCRILGDATKDAVNDITGILKDAAIEPINDYTGELQEGIEQITNQTQPVVEAMLEAETSLYQKAFEKALDDYKNRLLDLVGGFNLTWSGLGFKAQIDVVGSDNYILYHKVMAEIEKFSVDVVEVNSQYEKILGYVDSQIDQIYKQAITGLEKLKKSLKASVGKSIERAQAKSQMSDAVVTAMTGMGDTLLTFMDKQILAMSQNLDMQQESICDAGNAVVEQVMKQNTDMTDSFTSAIRASMKDFIQNGFFFSKREYLFIDGSDGLKEKIRTLALTQEEKDNMELNQWMDQAGEIIDIYTDLGIRIKQLMDETAKELTGTAGDNQSVYEGLLAQIAALQKEFYAFRQGVQKQFDEAVEYFHETDPNIIRMKGNVLIDV